MTKLLIPLLAVLAVVWLWRRSQRHVSDAAPHATAQPTKALPMIACARCGVHIPRDAAVHGSHGDYCCAAHRREAEGDLSPR